MKSPRSVMTVVAACVLFCAFLLYCFAGCSAFAPGSAGDQDQDENEQHPATTASGTVGAAGGTVETENGARIIVPPGALIQETTITIYSYPGNSGLPPTWCPLAGMAGALRLEPEGLQFQIPAEITVPLGADWRPGDQIPLFALNASSKTWDQTAENVTINSDGRSFSGEISHFSGYGGGSVEGLVDSGSLGQFRDQFTDWFRENVFDLGNIRERENECFELVGMDFDLQYKQNSVTGGDVWRVGRMTDNADAPLIMVDYIYDVTNGNTVDGYVRITVTNYYDCTKPMFLIRSDRSILMEGETTSVYADVSCAGTALTGKDITFDIKSGPGTVSPGNTTTDASGTASTTFTAGNENSVARACYYSCPTGDGEMLDREIMIAVAPDQFNLQISYDQTMTQQDFTDTLSYSGTVVILVTQDNGDGTADVEGSETFPVTGSGTAGDCSTVTSGSVDFTITGTLITDSEGAQTLDLTQEVYFDYTKTTSCPDEPPFDNPFAGGDSSDYILPVENGYTIDRTDDFPGVTNHIVYVLTF